MVLLIDNVMSLSRYPGDSGMLSRVVQGGPNWNSDGDGVAR